MATDGSQLFLGGDFTTVNGKHQQGFAIFPAKPDPVYPSNPATAPTVTSTSAGTVTVSFPAVSSADVGTLNYEIFRDGGKTPIATLTATSWPWALPVLQYQDTGLAAGLVAYLHLRGNRRHAPERTVAILGGGDGVVDEPGLDLQSDGPAGQARPSSGR